jgi:hypothetical protein
MKKTNECDVALMLTRAFCLPGKIVQVCHWMFVQMAWRDAKYLFLRLTKPPIATGAPANVTIPGITNGAAMTRHQAH